MSSVSHNTCCVVGCCALSSPFLPLPLASLGQWDDMLKVGLHLASYLNRAATSQEHGSLPDCGLIKELLGWPSVPVGGQGSGLSRAPPHSHCEALKRRIAAETPPRPHNTTYFPPKQKMPLMGGLFPSLPASPPHPFQTSVNYLAFPEDYLSGPSTRVSWLSRRQAAAKICIRQTRAAECNNKRWYNVFWRLFNDSVL